jgi:membrane protein YqaA with SNARE-associated domain
MIDETTQSRAKHVRSRPRHNSKYIRIGVLLVVALGLNMLVLAIPGSWIEGLRGYGLLGYAAAFGITALANASVVVPVPYPTVIAQLARVLNDTVGVAIVGAAGSTVGETTAFAVGRAGRAVLEDTRFGRWLKQQLRSRARAWIVLFLLSAPPNPFFDVAGLTAGSLGVPFSIFFTATFAGRIIKLLIFAELGRGLL